MRLTRRGRAVLVVVIAAGLVIGFWATAWASPNVRGRPPQVVIVTPGQTLWGIATVARPNADPRLTVQRIMDLNHLKEATVMPGQRLVMP